MLLSRSGISSQKKSFVPNTSVNEQNSRILPLSLLAHNGMGNMSFSDIIEKRRNDYQYWQQFIERTNLFTPVFSNLPSGVCPLGFPVKAKDRDLLKLRLQKEGIYLKIYWDLPETVGREFVNSHELSNQVFTLPIYPELNPGERDKIVNLLTSDSI